MYSSQCQPGIIILEAKQTEFRDRKEVQDVRRKSGYFGGYGLKVWQWQPNLIRCGGGVAAWIVFLAKKEHRCKGSGCRFQGVDV